MPTVVLKLGDDISTDIIYPGRYMATVLPAETPQFAFADNGAFNRRLRTKEIPPGSIIVAGKNFGCGSSREHAPWALADYGFRAIIAPSFADIFANNCLKNGLLAVVLSESEVAQLTNRAGTGEGYELTVDLRNKTVSDTSGFLATFEIGDFQRHCLLEGLDDIGLTLQHEEAIAAYEQRRPI